MKNERKDALLLVKEASTDEFSGIGQRVQNLRSLLTSSGFRVEVSSKIDLAKESRYDLACVVSFASASNIPKIRKRTEFLWFDAMDSWKLTRRTLFPTDPIRESVKFIRDFRASFHFKDADLVTYCSKRDLEFDGIELQNVLVLPPYFPPLIELKDLGRRFVFVGTSKYRPNYEAYKFLEGEAKKGKFKEIPLFVYGEGYERIPTAEGIEIKGRSPNEELYGSQDVHLVPIWRGAGIKYKTFSPLALGLHVISSVEGANGLVRGPLLHVMERKSDFSKALDDSNIFQGQDKSPQNYLSSNNTEEIVRQVMAFKRSRSD